MQIFYRPPAERTDLGAPPDISWIRYVRGTPTEIRALVCRLCSPASRGRHLRFTRRHCSARAGSALVGESVHSNDGSGPIVEVAEAFAETRWRGHQIYGSKTLYYGTHDGCEGPVLIALSSARQCAHCGADGRDAHLHPPLHI